MATFRNNYRFFSYSLISVPISVLALSAFSLAADDEVMPPSAGPIVTLDAESNTFVQPTAEQMQILRAEALEMLRQHYLDQGLLENDARATMQLPAGMTSMRLPLEHMNFITIQQKSQRKSAKQKQWPQQ